MAARERQRFTKLAPPVVDRLARSRVDEVEGDAVEVCACHLECGECFSGGMDASERLQNVVAQRLHAERHAIDSCMRVAGEALRLDAARVRFERDLGAGRYRPKLRDAIEDRSDRARLHQRGRAAAEENAGNLARPGECRGVLELAQVGCEETGLVDAAEAHVTVEVAVRALLGAERPVDVDAEAHVVRRPPARGRRA